VNILTTLAITKGMQIKIPAINVFSCSAGMKNGSIDTLSKYAIGRPASELKPAL